MGGFELIYPPPEGEDSPRGRSIARFLETAQALLDKVIRGGGRRINSRFGVDPAGECWKGGGTSAGAGEETRVRPAEVGKKGIEGIKKVADEKDNGDDGLWCIPTNVHERLSSRASIDRAMIRRRYRQRQNNARRGVEQSPGDRERLSRTSDYQEPQQPNSKEPPASGLVASDDFETAYSVTEDAEDSKAEKFTPDYVTCVSAPAYEIGEVTLPAQHDEILPTSAIEQPSMSEPEHYLCQRHRYQGHDIDASIELRHWDLVIHHSHPPARQHPSGGARAGIKTSVHGKISPDAPTRKRGDSLRTATVDAATLAIVGPIPTGGRCAYTGETTMCGLGRAQENSVGNHGIRTKCGDRHEKPMYFPTTFRPTSATTSAALLANAGISGVSVQAAGIAGIGTRLYSRQEQETAPTTVATTLVVDGGTTTGFDDGSSKMRERQPVRRQHQRPRTSHGRMETQVSMSLTPCIRQLDRDANVTANRDTKMNKLKDYRTPSMPTSHGNYVYHLSPRDQERRETRTPRSCRPRALSTAEKHVSPMSLILAGKRQSCRISAGDSATTSGGGCSNTLS